MAKTNKERLICIEGLLNTVVAWQGNHMEHHKKLYDRLFKTFLVVLGAAMTAVLGGVGLLIVKIFG